MVFYKKIFLALLSGLVFLLSGCGGSGSGATTTVVSTNVQMSGAVVDGYIQNAKVCLDKNANSYCDTDEPATRSLSDGTYTLDISKADEGLYSVVAEVTTESYDADDHGQPISNPYNFTAPVGKESVVSPFTTIVKALQDKQPSLTPEQAGQAILAKLSLYDDNNDYMADIFTDYVSKENTDANYAILHDVAKEITQGTALYIKQFSDNSLVLSGDNAAGLLTLAMDTAFENLSGIKELALKNDTTVRGIIFALPANPQDRLAKTAAQLSAVKSLADTPFASLQQPGSNFWVTLDFYRNLAKSRMRIYDFKDGKRLEIDGETNPSIASFVASQLDNPRDISITASFDIAGYLDAFYGIEANRKTQQLDLSGKTLLVKDLILPEYYTRKLDGKTISFSEGDTQISITGNIQKFAKQYPDEGCINNLVSGVLGIDVNYKCFEENVAVSNLETYILDHTGLASAVDVSTNTAVQNALEEYTDNPHYFVPANPVDWTQGGTIWRYNLTDQQAYYVRDYKIEGESNQYLVEGVHARPFETSISMIMKQDNTHWKLRKIEFAARDGATRFIAYNPSAAKKILQLLQAEMAAESI